MSTKTPYEIKLPLNGSGSGTNADIYFAQRSNVDISTNLNNVGVTEVPIDNSMFTNGTGWAINGNGIEYTGTETVKVRCSFNIHITSTVARPNIKARLYITNTANPSGVATGPVAATGYIRNVSGHNESSLHVANHWVTMETGDIITVRTIQEAETGNVTMESIGTSQLLLERIVNV